MPAFGPEDIEALCQWDTPTICNALEVVVPERRSIGYTTTPMVPIDPGARPIVGLARTGSIRSKESPRGGLVDRVAWYEYVAAGDLPTIVVLQDIDDQPGYGCFWGEVQSNVHKALGALGCVTNGTYRDIDAWAPGFQILGAGTVPSHAHVHMVDFGKPVNVFGMNVNHDDLIHCDRHGAVVVPAEAVKELPAAVDLLTRRERVLLDACATKSDTVEALRAALSKMADIH
jgi:regulator of RNase E activity RraA